MGHRVYFYLYLQGQKLISEAVNDVVRGIDLGDNEPSESDTDSLSTPTNSPSHRPMAGNACYIDIKKRIRHVILNSTCTLFLFAYIHMSYILK